MPIPSGVPPTLPASDDAWQYAGIASVHAVGASDLVLRNVNSGAFEVYDIAGNTLVGAASLGAVGLDWQLGGFAVDPPPVSTASMGDSGQAAQLVQAMAGFAGGSSAADISNAVLFGAETSQQQSLLATPHACDSHWWCLKLVWSLGG